MYANLRVTEFEKDRETPKEVIPAWKVIVDEFGVHVHTDLSDDGNGYVEGPVRTFDDEGALEIVADY